MEIWKYIGRKDGECSLKYFGDGIGKEPVRSYFRLHFSKAGQTRYENKDRKNNDRNQ